MGLYGILHHSSTVIETPHLPATLDSQKSCQCRSSLSFITVIVDSEVAVPVSTITAAAEYINLRATLQARDAFSGLQCILQTYPTLLTNSPNSPEFYSTTPL